MSQPKWSTIQRTDYSCIQIDETGVYAPEMEIAQDLENGTFEVSRFSLDRLKLSHGGYGYLIPLAYTEDWPHPVHMYREWFDGEGELTAIARFIGSTENELRTAFQSLDTLARAWAWESVGSYWGFANLDGDPLILTEDELNERWAK